MPLATFAGSYHPRLPEGPIKLPNRISGLRARPGLLLTRNPVPAKLKMYLDKTRWAAKLARVALSFLSTEHADCSLQVCS